MPNFPLVTLMGEDVPQAWSRRPIVIMDAVNDVRSFDTIFRCLHGDIIRSCDSEWMGNILEVYNENKIATAFSKWRL